MRSPHLKKQKRSQAFEQMSSDGDPVLYGHGGWASAQCQAAVWEHA